MRVTAEGLGGGAQDLSFGGVPGEFLFQALVVCVQGGGGLLEGGDLLFEVAHVLLAAFAEGSLAGFDPVSLVSPLLSGWDCGMGIVRGAVLLLPSASPYRRGRGHYPVFLFAATAPPHDLFDGFGAAAYLCGEVTGFVAGGGVFGEGVRRGMWRGDEIEAEIWVERIVVILLFCQCPSLVHSLARV